jgi:hypothetical protein
MEETMVQILRAPAARGLRHDDPATAGRTTDWKGRAIAASIARGPAGPAEELARAVRALTGQALPAEAIWADSAEQVAGAVLDDVHFRWQGGQLVLVRPCVHCGLGLIASPALPTLADLGHALADWQPRHADCEQEDPADSS